MIYLLILIFLISLSISILVFFFRSVPLRRKLNLILLTFIGLTLLGDGMVIGLYLYYGNQVPEGTIH